MSEKLVSGQAWVRILGQEFFDGRVPATHPYNFGFFPAMMRLMSTHREVGKKFAALFEEVMFAPSVWSRRDRELIAAVAAAAQDCEY